MDYLSVARKYLCEKSEKSEITPLGSVGEGVSSHISLFSQPKSSTASLHGLPAIEAAPAVYLTASSEDAEAIERLGRVATTLEGGAWEADVWTEPLRGKTVAVIDPQRSVSHLALKALRRVTKQTFVVDLPADSAAAWVEQGGDRNELMRLTREAVERSREAETLEEVVKGHAVAL